MFKAKLISFLFGLRMTFCTCQPEIKQSGFTPQRDEYEITRIGELPSVLTESSGMTVASGKPSFWVHNDGGNDPEIYEVDLQGVLLSTLFVKGLNNVDWEDITRDPRGNVYVGDFGNNGNNRQDLTIYRINPKTAAIDRINFRYADQTSFPPIKQERTFDCEAMFFYRDSLYLFSKNRGTDDRAKLYAVPAKPGDYVLTPRDRIFLNSEVTGADIAPDGKRFALLSYGKLFFFGLENGKINFDHPLTCVKVARNQAESVTFVSDTDVLISNEQRKIYYVRRKKQAGE
jgi:hypothetical protein